MLPLQRSTMLVLLVLLGSLGFGLSMDGVPIAGRDPTFPVEVCPLAPCVVSPPVLALKVCVPACGDPGQELDYRIIVENRSATAAHHVVIHDPLPANARFVRAHPEPASVEPELQWQLGTIEGCGRREICLTLAPTAAGEIKNCVRITYEHGVCVCTQVGAAGTPEQVPVPPRPQDDREGGPGKVTVGGISIVKTAPKRAYVSSPIPYQITVTNQGTDAATNVTLVDALPAQTTFVSASHNGRLVDGERGGAAARVVQWALGTLAPRESRTVELRLRGTVVGELVNESEASADGGVRATSEARTELLGAAGLLLMVVDTRDPVEVGEETQYDMIVRAQGSAPITNLRITANVPPELAIVRIQGPTDHVKDGQKVMYEPLTLPAGKDTVFRIFVKALKPGDLRFRMQMTADQLTAGPLLEEESTNVYAGN